MHKKIIIWSMAVGLFFGSIPSLSAQVETDVFVDLSVLDALGGASNPAVSSGPLFPVVKTPKSSVSRPAKKRRVKKAKPAPQAKLVVPAKEDIKIDVKLAEPQKAEPQTPEAPEPAAPAPVVPVSAEVVSTEVVNPQPQPELPQIPFVESSEPVKVVDVEPSAHAEKMPEPVVGAEASDAGSSAQDAPAAQDVPAAQDAAEKEDNTKKNANPRLAFAPEVAELTPEQQKQIDTVVASFEDAAANKIAIYSYNLDDGVDVFRKKRTSLNRAVEVRSYLIRKGYKNFSIKVVNVEPGSEKINTVEIEELK